MLRLQLSIGHDWSSEDRSGPVPDRVSRASEQATTFGATAKYCQSHKFRFRLTLTVYVPTTATKRFLNRIFQWHEKSVWEAKNISPMREQNSI